MVPDMNLAQRCWVVVSAGDSVGAADIMETIRERNMAPWYAHLCHHHPELFTLDEPLLAKMKEANEAEKKRICEVRDNNMYCLYRKTSFFCLRQNFAVDGFSS